MTQKNKKILKRIRWIVALALGNITSWWAATLLCAKIFGIIGVPVNIVSLIILLFLVPATAVFFVSRYITCKLLDAKYQNKIAWIFVIICALWIMLLFYGLAHMAY